MNPSFVLQQLEKANNSEERAAIVAETLISQLPTEVAMVAYKCAFVPWFNADLVQAFSLQGTTISKEERRKQLLDMILMFPFIENNPGGFSFHSLTRAGIILKFSNTDPQRIIDAYEDALTISNELWDDDNYALLTLMGLVITDKPLMVETNLPNFFKRLTASGAKTKIDAFFSAFKEIEEMPFVSNKSFSYIYWKLKGEHLLNRGYLELARESLIIALEFHPNNTSCISLLARSYALDGDFDEALRLHDEAIAIEPSADNLLERAATLSFAGRAKQAISDLTKVIQKRQVEAKERGLLFIFRGELHRRQGNDERAISDFSKAISSTEESSLIYLLRASTYINMKLYHKALDDLNVILSRDLTTQEEALSLRARAYRRQKKYDLAFNDLNTILVKNPDHISALAERSSTYYEIQNYGQAAEDIEKVLTLHPELFWHYKLAAQIYADQGDDKRAEELFLSAIATDIDNPGFYLTLCLLTYYQYGYINISLKACQKFLLHRNDSGLGHSAMGFLYLLKGELADAEAHLTRALELSKKKAAIHLNLGIVYWLRGNYNVAEDHFNNAIRHLNRSTYTKNGQRKPTGHHTEALKGWILIMLGHTEQGLALMMKHLPRITKDKEIIDFKSWTGRIISSPTRIPTGLDEIDKELQAIPNPRDLDWFDYDQ